MESPHNRLKSLSWKGWGCTEGRGEIIVQLSVTARDLIGTTFGGRSAHGRRTSTQANPFSQAFYWLSILLSVLVLEGVAMHMEAKNENVVLLHRSGLDLMF